MNTQGTRKWWALGALALSMLAVGLDLTVLNVALPTLWADLHASTSQLQWFASGYTLVLAAALLPARHPRRPVRPPGNSAVIALIVFGIALAGLRVRAVGGRADRRACRTRPSPAAFLMPLSMSAAAGAVHRGGAAEGDRDLGDVNDDRHPARADRRRLAAGQLLVGFGIPDQRADGAHRTGRGPVAAAGVTQQREVGAGWTCSAWSSPASGLLGVTYGVIQAGSRPAGGRSTRSGR